MEIIKTAEFGKAFRELPKEIQNLYFIQEKRFQKDWRDPRLHVKKIDTLPLALSFRITRRYRAFFYFTDPATAVFFEIDHRKDVYR